MGGWCVSEGHGIRLHELVTSEGVFCFMRVPRSRLSLLCQHQPAAAELFPISFRFVRAVARRSMW